VLRIEVHEDQAAIAPILRRWRWFWDYGGGTLTDLFSHWIDTVRWIMDDSEPVKAQASGGIFFYPEWECPDTLQAGFVYPRK
jgi:predicted dehydrogenase